MRGGVGFAYEYGGAAVERMAMDERMTMCNMSIEGGARIGYVNPDETTYAYLAGRPFAPAGDAFGRAKAWWRSMASDPDAAYDDVVQLDGAAIEPRVTWGINPGQSVGVSERIPDPASAADEDGAIGEALEFMGFTAGAPISGTRVDVAFVGSCTNSRLSDLREAARVVKGHRVAAPREGARRSRIEERAPRGGGRGAARDLPGGRLRVARGGLLDVPGDEPGPPERPRGCARRPRTATSRGGREARPAARS